MTSEPNQVTLGVDTTISDARRADGTVDVSIVIPTFNRCDRLRRVLEALDRQERSLGSGTFFDFDVIVVSDGSTDGTSDMVRSLSTSYELRLIEQDNAGPGAARNAGWRASDAPVVLFIDDDVVPAPGCVRAHVSRRAGATGLVVIGPMLTPTDVELSPWVDWEQHQLYKQYRWFAEGAPAHPRQFYTGNASVDRAALERLDGFDTAFRRAEDVELAHRLEDIDQSFVFEPGAEAFHYAERSIESWLNVAADYGTHDVSFSEGGQPWMRRLIAEGFRERNPVQRAVVRLTVARPERAARWRDRFVATAIRAHRLRFELVSRASLSLAYGINYYGHVAAALGSKRAFDDLLAGRRAAGQRDFCALFVLEQTLGHITHSKNLHAIVPDLPGVRAVFLPISDGIDGPLRHVPGWSNWTVRAGLRARRAVRIAKRQLSNERPPVRADAMFVHSQVPAVLLGHSMKSIPTVVSLDATPIQYDELGEFYAHARGSERVERLKHDANRRCYERAAHLITWSDWAKAGLVEQYGVSPRKVTVIAPGVDVAHWAATREPADVKAVVRVLFVGGDLHRKGGLLLVDAWRRIRADPDLPDVELHLVTGAAIDAEPGLVVHRGLTANSPELIDLYRRADVFCLPTLGDCLPMVLAEAGASGLPLISTNVGAISELVRDGETGRLVPPGDVDALEHALRDLVGSPSLRAGYGEQARALVTKSHDARVNAARIIDVLRTAAGDPT